MSTGASPRTFGTRLLVVVPLSSSMRAGRRCSTSARTTLVPPR
jgi:hypothetical protein